MPVIVLMMAAAGILLAAVGAGLLWGLGGSVLVIGVALFVVATGEIMSAK